MGISEMGTIPAPRDPDPQIKNQARELEEIEKHLSEAAHWIKADNPAAATYLLAVRHGLSLGRLRLHDLAYSYGRNQGIA